MTPTIDQNQCSYGVVFAEILHFPVLLRRISPSCFTHVQAILNTHNTSNSVPCLCLNLLCGVRVSWFRASYNFYFTDQLFKTNAYILRSWYYYFLRNNLSLALPLNLNWLQYETGSQMKLYCLHYILVSFCNQLNVFFTYRLLLDLKHYIRECLVEKYKYI